MPRGGKRPNAGRKRTKPVDAPTASLNSGASHKSNAASGIKESKRTPPRRGRPKGELKLKTRSIRAKLHEDMELTAQRTVEQIRRGALYDVRALFDEKGNLRPIHELRAEEAAAIAGIEVVKRNITAGDGSIDTVIKVKLADRAKYVEMAAKHHGLLTEKIEHSGALVIQHEVPVE